MIATKDFRAGRKVKDLTSNKTLEMFDLGFSDPNLKEPDCVWLDEGPSINILFYRKFEQLELVKE